MTILTKENIPHLTRRNSSKLFNLCPGGAQAMIDLLDEVDFIDGEDVLAIYEDNQLVAWLNYTIEYDKGLKPYYYVGNVLSIKKGYGRLLIEKLQEQELSIELVVGFANSDFDKLMKYYESLGFIRKDGQAAFAVWTP